MNAFRSLSIAVIMVWATHETVAQVLSPQIQWQRSLGGSGTDTAFGLVETLDGGVLVVGYSDSPTNTAKMAPNRGGADFWIIRLDANGNTLWDKSYGGSGDEKISKAVRLSDDGFVLAGYSDSDTNSTNGTKTSPVYGSFDFWLVRIDKDGNQIWDRSYGGSGGEYIEMIREIPGGFILGGPSSSAANGNKSSPYYGGDGDYWVVCVDESGNKLWDKSFGSSGDESMEDIGLLADGYLLLGRSFSPVGGTKTNQPFGQFDFWLIRTDENGNEIWQRAFGGLSYDAGWKVQPTSDGGCVLGGTSFSGVNGNKATSAFGGGDFWLLQLDQNGNKVWERVYGGTGLDDMRSVVRTVDGGFIVGGKSGSGPSGNKTSENFGNNDFWLIRLDSTGNKLWDLSLGGNNIDDLFPALQASDGGFYAAGRSASLPGGNKTNANYGGYDVWVVKLSPEQPKLRILPQSLSSILTNGYQFYLSGISNAYAIEWSANLANWTRLQTNVLSTTGSEVVVVDHSASTDSRYYRALRLQ